MAQADSEKVINAATAKRGSFVIFCPLLRCKARIINRLSNKLAQKVTQPKRAGATVIRISSAVLLSQHASHEEASVCIPYTSAVDPAMSQVSSLRVPSGKSSFHSYWFDVRSKPLPQRP